MGVTLRCFGTWCGVAFFWENCRCEGLDVIGDVHGCADKLEGLLQELDYEERGTYRYAGRGGGRQAMSVGDLIDLGTVRGSGVDRAHAKRGHPCM